MNNLYSGIRFAEGDEDSKITGKDEGGDEGGDGAATMDPNVGNGDDYGDDDEGDISVSCAADADEEDKRSECQEAGIQVASQAQNGNEKGKDFHIKTSAVITSSIRAYNTADCIGRSNNDEGAAKTPVKQADPPADLIESNTPAQLSNCTPNYKLKKQFIVSGGAAMKRSTVNGNTNIELNGDDIDNKVVQMATSNVPVFSGYSPQKEKFKDNSNHQSNSYFSAQVGEIGTYSNGDCGALFTTPFKRHVNTLSSSYFHFIRIRYWQ